MKLLFKYIKIIVPVVIILITAGAFASIPALREQFKKDAPVELPQEEIAGIDEQDKAIIEELSQVMHAMDTMTVLTIDGSVEGQDVADSTAGLQSAFSYTRQGNQAYYQFNRQEIISLTDAYIVIAHDVKKIFLSRPKEVMKPIRVPVKAEVDFLSHESYSVSRETVGRLTTISLNNPSHASCRAYSVSFDSLNIIRSSVMRMTNPQAMTDPSRDKILKVTISNWELGVVRKELLRKERYITFINGGIAPAARLSDYDLIND
ncbi:hypothetical protein [Chitinophaga rhizophila]|uniref:Outer membrane lipoprotein-sorting protein n=1 Tax=Chitinophaga rhizophila TaxID=2866212 RepID=A0ABS7G4X8_9BACT|nr:hypothetical protein [Chitinophaga rhizophila]MBW8682703.1 hypothetical protein [Chitinophaga rhizophila]